MTHRRLTRSKAFDRRGDVHEPLRPHVHPAAHPWAALAQAAHDHAQTGTATARHTVTRRTRAQAGHAAGAALPVKAGQDAFAAIQEIVAILEADPATDWNKVDLAGLRRHLVDMHEITLNAEVVERDVPGGFEARVTGAGRTAAAVRRIVPAHARFVGGDGALRVSVQELPDGAVLIATTSDPQGVVRLRGLGFFGLLVGGHSHQAHHLALARGGDPHAGGHGHAGH